MGFRDDEMTNNDKSLGAVRDLVEAKMGQHGEAQMQE